MKKKKAIIAIAFLLFGGGGICAQESTMAAGGEAAGTEGTVSYSLGQIVYTRASGTDGSMAQGVQQPFEISIVLGIDEWGIGPELSLSPNPAHRSITLRTDDSSNLSYELYDLQGKVLKKEMINDRTTEISLEGQASASYFLTVSKKGQIVKTFKIIKN